MGHHLVVTMTTWPLSRPGRFLAHGGIRIGTQTDPRGAATFTQTNLAAPRAKKSFGHRKMEGFVQQKWSYREKWRGLSNKKIGFTVLPKKRWRCYRKIKILRTKNLGVAEKKRGFTNIIISE